MLCDSVSEIRLRGRKIRRAEIITGEGAQKNSPRGRRQYLGNSSKRVRYHDSSIRYYVRYTSV